MDPLWRVVCQDDQRVETPRHLARRYTLANVGDELLEGGLIEDGAHRRWRVVGQDRGADGPWFDSELRRRMDDAFLDEVAWLQVRERYAVRTKARQGQRRRFQAHARLADPPVPLVGQHEVRCKRDRQLRLQQLCDQPEIVQKPALT